MAPRTTAVSIPAAEVPAVVPAIPAKVSGGWPQTREAAILASRAVVQSTTREYGSTASRMCVNPEGLIQTFAVELLSAYCDQDGAITQHDPEMKTDIAIAKVGFKLASMMHERLQNKGLVKGEEKEALSVNYVWRDIAANQVGVILSLIIELDQVAKTRTSSLMRQGVLYWMNRYKDIFTSSSNTTADHQDLLDELDF